MKNEKNSLPRCLSSIKAIADEIIVVDTGSTDESICIASEYGGLVFFYKWANDFSSARNYCLDKASSDWILVLDADEELDEKSLHLLKRKLQNPDTDAYLLSVRSLMQQQHEFLDKCLQLRLFRNNVNYRYKGNINEQVLDSILEHNPGAVIKTAEDIIILHHGCKQKNTSEQYRLKCNIDLIDLCLNQEREIPLKNFLLGREYYLHSRFSEALAYFRLALEFPNDQAEYIPELIRYIAICLYKQNKTSEALAYLNDSLSIKAGSSDLLYLKGLICLDLALYSLALASFKEALSCFPSPPYHDPIYYHSKYTCQYLLGALSEYFLDLDGALLYYFDSLKNNPYLIASLRRMIAIVNPRKNPDYTINSLNRIFDLSDRNLQAEIASIFYDEGAYQLTVDCINRLESSGSIQESIRLLKGLSLMRLKKYSEAVEVLNNITRDTSLYIEARQYLFFYYWIIKDSPMAFEYLRQLKKAEADPTIMYVLNLLTRNHADSTDIAWAKAHQLAKEVLSFIVELRENKKTVRTFSILTPLLGERPSMLLAEAYYNCDKYEFAKEEFLSLLKTGSKYPLVFYYLGKTCWALGDLGLALEYFQQAINGGLDTPKLNYEKANLEQELANVK